MAKSKRHKNNVRGPFNRNTFREYEAFLIQRIESKSPLTLRHESP